ncbi:MAG: hypothetical protein HRU21_06005 [Pseudomonadales bacterium]|nr:hypothetical protein [Pseudomonadales bacterium]
MLFRLCLWLLAKRIQYLTDTHPQFQQLIARRACVISFELANSSACRYFEFKWGKVNSEAKRHSHASLSFQISSAKDFRYLLWIMAKDPHNKSQMITLIRQAKIRFAGDMSQLTWFMQIADYFAPQSFAAKSSDTAEQIQP